MKKTFAIVFLLLASVGVQKAQNASYEELMGMTLAAMGQANNPESWQEAASRFERLSMMNPGDWLPSYYAALATVNKCFVPGNGSETDKTLDQAQTFLDAAAKKNAPADEIHVMQALIHQARISVNPMDRGMKYAGLAAECLGKAEAVNAGNPRIYYLRGQNVYNTPPMFGGGKGSAKPLFEKAARLFEQASPAPLHPAWGQADNTYMLGLCTD